MDLELLAEDLLSVVIENTPPPPVDLYTLLVYVASSSGSNAVSREFRKDLHLSPIRCVASVCHIQSPIHFYQLNMSKAFN